MRWRPTEPCGVALPPSGHDRHGGGSDGVTGGRVFLLVVSGAVGSLLTMCLVSEYWERDASGRLRLLAIGALVAGTTSEPSSVTPPSWVRVSFCSPPRSWLARRTP